MWKVKMFPGMLAGAAVLVFVPVLFLTACGGKADEKSEILLYEAGNEGTVSGSAVSGSTIRSDETEFDTTTVQKKTYKEEFADTADIKYTDTETIYIFEENAVLDEVKVKPSQKVKKGDVLAVYHVETSKTKLAKQKILVDQARADYESGLSALNSDLSQAKQELEQLSSQTEKKVKKLEIKKIEKQIAAYKKQEKEVVSQEKDYAELVRIQKGTTLVAPKSGVITKTAQAKEGEEIDSSVKIIEMRNSDKWVLAVTDPESKLRYNMDVRLRLGKSMKDYQDEVKGKVITSSDITGVGETDEDGNAIVYIEVSDSDKKKYDFENQNIYVNAVSFSVEDALVVDAEAVYKESVDVSNKLYVMLVENGKLHKRYIVSNYKTEKEYLVDQGVFENQTLAILN